MRLPILKEILERYPDCRNQEVDVVIQVRLPFTTVGGTSVVSIKSCYKGIDWDKGKMILVPEEQLTPADRDFETKFKDLQDRCGWLELENRRLKAEIKNLRKNNA